MSTTHAPFYRNRADGRVVMGSPMLARRLDYEPYGGGFKTVKILDNETQKVEERAAFSVPRAAFSVPRAASDSLSDKDVAPVRGRGRPSPVPEDAIVIQSNRIPETAIPETAIPETAIPDVVVPDVVVPDAVAPNTGFGTVAGQSDPFAELAIDNMQALLDDIG